MQNSTDLPYHRGEYIGTGSSHALAAKNFDVLLCRRAGGLQSVVIIVFVCLLPCLKSRSQTS